VLFDHNKFVVKSETKGFSPKKSFEILDAESGQLLATAKDVTGFLAGMLGKTAIEVRDVSNNALVCSVRRDGLLFKKDQVLGPEGAVVGRYKAKMFSLSGGFHVYDKDAKHIAEIKGKMLKAEYKFVAPDKTTEMGSVSRTWAGLAKSLISGGGSYVVQIDPKFAGDTTAKTLMLGATIAVETIFKKKKGGKGSDESSADGDDE
jgi:uncharacterized protein YxjI